MRNQGPGGWPGSILGSRRGIRCGCLGVVFGPAGPAWLPIAVFFARRGHAVYRVSSAKAAELRRFLRRHAKSNGIDAETLARLPLADPRGPQPRPGWLVRTRRPWTGGSAPVTG